MNKIHKTIYSKALACIVVVSEITKGAGGKKTGRRKLAAMLMASPLLGGVSGAAFAANLPTGGQVVSGDATIITDNTVMTINQTSDKMIANWQSFSIGPSYNVTFNQPDTSSVALNRVVGQDPSQIFGNLNANGQVFLLNPNGIAIGANGSVQTGGFIASTLDIKDEDFLAGKYQFNGIGGTIVNDGTISGKIVALIAPSVTNNGTITGDTALAAGTDVLLDFDGDGLLSVEVQANTLAGLVENNGLIQADDLAILTAKGASDALKGVVNNRGTVEATVLVAKNGRILLLGDKDNGQVIAAGTLTADEFIETSAATVAIDKDLSVETTDGEWLIDSTNITLDEAMASATETALASGDVTITTTTAATDDGNIIVESSIDWSKNKLTLRADNDITINAELTSTGTTASDGLVLQYAQTTSTGDYSINAPVNLASGSLFQTQKGTDTAITYTVITSLGAAGSTTTSDLQGINGGLTGNYVLGADINASGTSTWNSGEGFNPLGDITNNFKGKFDGLGHTITDLTINRPTEDYVGLFGFSNNASIRNVGLIGGSVTGQDNVGGLAGYYSFSSMSNAYTTGNVNGRNIVGGLAGSAGNGTITNAYATGNVTGSADIVGGLVGNTDGNAITGAYASGDVAGGGFVGGLVGISTASASIADAYATGDVTGSGERVGGLAGFNGAGSSITRIYATGAVSGSGSVGALVGQNNATETSIITDSFWNTETSGQTKAIGTDGNSQTVTGLTSAQMADSTNFTGWDFTSVWDNQNDQTAPYLRAIDPTKLLMGDGTLYTLIYTLDQLQAMNNDLSAGYLQWNNIDASSTSSWNSGLGFDPIGDTVTKFTGKFNGLGHTISGLTINRADTNQIGLFGYANGATIQNIGLKGGNVTGDTNVGSLVGFATNGSTITNAYSTGNVIGNLGVGGLVGVNTTGSTVTHAYATGSVTGNGIVGGLVGSNSSATISSAYATGNVTGGSKLGGLVGVNSGTVTNGYYNSDTTGQSDSGKGTGLTTALMMDSANFTGFDFDTVWDNQNDQSAPYLRAVDPTSLLLSDGEFYTTVKTLDELQAVNAGLAGKYALFNAIDASATSTWNADAGFVPLGSNANNFMGTFDGLGHIISNLTINRPTTNEMGLFGVVGGTVRNLGLEDVMITGQTYVGGLAAANDGGSISNSYVTGSVTGIDWVGGLVGFNTGTLSEVHTNATVKGTKQVGGLVGENFLSNISDSYATGNVNDGHEAGRESLGGLVGKNYNGTITNSYATGNVNNNTISTGDREFVGGLVGLNDVGTITNSYATGSVMGVWRVGGLIGKDMGSIIQTSHATGTVEGIEHVGGLVGRTESGSSISDSFATGNVTAKIDEESGSLDGARVGGLVGINHTGSTIQTSYATGNVSGTSSGGLVGENYGTIKNAYATGNVTAIDSSSHTRGGLVGLNLGSITSAYATGAVDGISETRGGLVGRSSGGTVINSFYDNQTSGQSDTDQGTSLTTLEMQDPFIFIDRGWDFTTIWGKSSVNENGAYMMLRGVGPAASLYDNYVALAGDTAKTYGDANPTTPGFTANSVGTSNVTLDWGSAITTATNAGSYAYTDTNVLNLSTNSGSSYIDYGTGALTVDKAALTVTAQDTTKTYGDSLSFAGSEFTATGLKNSETIGSVTLTSTGTSTTANAGTHDITSASATGGSFDINNYAVTYADGTLTVDKAALTVTAQDTSKTYGDSLSFAGSEFTATGLKNSETIGSVTLTSTGAINTANAGAYGITSASATGGSFDINNYAVTYSDGALTVNKAALTATATDDSKTYDGLAYSDGNGVDFSGFVNGENISALNGTLSFGGTAQGAVNAGSYAISATGLSADNYAITYVDGALTVNKAALTLSTSNVTKTYDDQLDATSSLLITAGALANGDALLGGTFAFTDKNAGTGKTVTVSNAAIIDGNNGGNYDVTYIDNTASVINQASISAITGITASDKTYDGSTTATLVTTGAGFTDMIAGDVLNVASGTGEFADKNAGNGKTVSITGLSLGGADAANYTLADTTAVTTADIAKAVISAITGIAASSKTYDGSTDATLNTPDAGFSGMVAGDTLNVASATGTFADKNAGADKTVGITGLSLGGTDAGNYTLADSTATTAADIAKAALTLLGLTVDDKTYDGTTVATISTIGTLDGAISGDSVTADTASAIAAFSDKNAGNGKTVTLNGLALSGADAGNYTIDGTATTTADITQAVISVIADITASNKTYDGTTATTLDTTGATFAGMVTGDTLTVTSATGSFGDKNAGADKTVSITGLSLGGADAANYTLADTTAVTTADITQAVISAITGITAADKTYDGSTDATLGADSAGFSGMVTGDTLTVATAAGGFADKNAGDDKSVTITGLSLGGADAGNYTLAGSTAVTTADIAQAVISAVTGITAENKIYDGTTVAALDTSGAGFSGIVSGDMLTVTSATGVFADKNAGDGKTVNITGLSLDGADAGNYTLADSTATTTADIGKAALTLLGLATEDKIYDGTTAAVISNIGTLDGAISGDSLTADTSAAVAAFSDKNAGTGKTVTVNGVVLSGADAGNYTIDGTATTTADIAKATISTITGIVAANKTYDGTTGATLSTSGAGFIGMVSGDALTVASATGAFANANPGTDKTVTITGITLSGADAENYILARSTATAMADIDALPEMRLTPMQVAFNGPDTNAVTASAIETAASDIDNGELIVLDAAFADETTAPEAESPSSCDTRVGGKGSLVCTDSQK